MSTLPRLVSASTQEEGYSVLVAFSDGLRATVDLSRVVGKGPMSKPLEDPAYFRRLRVSRSANTTIWPNGYDIAPETLYAWAEAARREASEHPGQIAL